MEKRALIYGRNPVLEHIRNGGPGELFISRKAHGKIIDTILSEAKKRSIKIIYEDKGFFEKLGPAARHQGVALELHQSQKAADISSLMDNAHNDGGIVVLLDQITDPHNAGSVIRTAEALGCSGIILPKSRSVGITPTVVKASAGATAHIDIATVGNVASFLDDAKSKGFWIIGSSEHGTADFTKARSLRPAIVIIGSEGAGMRRLTEEKCDYILAVPLKGVIGSLNASVAAGIILHEMLNH